MPSTTEPRPLTWHEELARDVTNAVDKTRAAWLSNRTVTATLLQAIAPHLEAAYRQGVALYLKERHLPVPELTAPLSEREKEVIIRAARGMSSKEIGDDLFLSEHTIKTHLRRVFAKTGSHDRAGAVVKLIFRGDITAKDVLEPKDAPR